ncbi:MAG: hypothetical protein OXT09_13140 [Myxococcales bacterium]|nr:hypothetical protein [Myxococcales bacterium]
MVALERIRSGEMPPGMALPPAARAILEVWLGGEPSDCSSL